MDQSLVTINILSFNRKDELRNTLTKVYEQDYKNIEVIVVDNASTDGSPELVEREFPEVKLIRLQSNIGIAGWNEGFKIAKGEYVLVLDDDAYPASNALIEALKEFSNEEVACITMNLKDLRNGNYYDGDWLPKEKNEKRYWPIFVGCAFIVMIKRLPTTFRFPDKYFLYQHELPMAAEIYSNNKKILFSPEILAYHNFKEHTGYKVFSDSSAFRNNLNFICSYLPKPLMIFYFLQSILFYLSRSLRHKWFSEYKKIILQNKFWLKSRPIRFQYFVQLRPLHLFNYPLWSKIFK